MMLITAPPTFSLVPRINYFPMCKKFNVIIDWSRDHYLAREVSTGIKIAGITSRGVVTRTSFDLERCLSIIKTNSEARISVISNKNSIHTPTLAVIN